MIQAMERWINDINFPPFGMLKEIDLQVNPKEYMKLQEEIKEDNLGTLKLEDTKLSAIGIVVNLKVKW